jgi:uracil DNA glycosylase
MNWEKFKDLFDESWHPKMKPFIESEACDKIYEQLKADSKRGKMIAPLSQNVWRCFKETRFQDVKVILIGLCPYHTMMNGQPVADGLMMSCSVTRSLQPSLFQLYQGMENKTELAQMKKKIKYFDILHFESQISEKALELMLSLIHI